MITYLVDDTDLATARFGISPLSETSLSLRALQRPERYPHLAGWRRTIDPALDRLDREVLQALVSSDESTPDFLNPRPLGGLDDVDAELRALTELSPRQFAADIEAVHPDGVPEVLRGPARQVHTRICEAVQAYWSLCIQPWWPRILATLRSDVTHRAMVASEQGQAPMLRGLSDSIDWRSGEIRAWNPNGPHYETPVGGRGLVFVPTHFTPWVSYPFSPEHAPYVLYPARARAATFERGSAPNAAALGRLIGRARARVLVEADQPISSTDLAARFGITVPGANQHLRLLRDAGLLHSTRHGRSVLYYRSRLGQAMLDDPSTF